MKTIAIQGIAGAYHEIAARKYFKEQREESIDILACTLFEDVITAVKKNPTIIGIMAIENTIVGSLLANHELIRKSDLVIVGEQKIRISHVLAALQCESLDNIKEIESNPIALMQCIDFLRTIPQLKIIESEDTALSAKLIAENKWKNHAAICSKYAAELYGLKILKENIETNKRNFTRFLLLINKFSIKDWIITELINKASIVFTLPHTKGSLSKILAIFSFYDVNLTRIQSVPIIGKEWEYLFYVDIIFDNILLYKQSINAVKPLANDFKILGEYKENNMVE
ncbi:MAG: prephenate dehydratase [Bacteroidales bacterium OttesenSCG-928-I14]|jgi:prephenate dehydratase|nr:prephenate dehydratase [Bacteroidales bacterium OttesenSCG-928-I14]